MTQIFDRSTQTYFNEQVFGGSFVEWAYRSREGRLLTSRRWFQWALSWLLGVWYSSWFSRFQVGPFIKNYMIRREDFDEPLSGYRSFNEFFVRKYKHGLRSFPVPPQTLGACAEGRLSVFRADKLETVINIKGVPVSLAEFLGSRDRAEMFLGGWIWVFRLCPVDYHCFHYPDSGTVLSHSKMGRSLESVHPIALHAEPRVFLHNIRHYCELASTHFGLMGLVDVGAMGVGTIVQEHVAGTAVQRGQIKGRFEFGGSTTVLMTHKKGPVPSADLRRQTELGYESYVRLGEVINEVDDS